MKDPKDQPETPSEPEGAQQDRPDPNVKPPDYMTVTESWRPSRTVDFEDKDEKDS